MNEPTLVMMAGVAGSGKSTLASALCDRLVRAELLPEEAIFEREEFADVGQAFRDETFPDTAMMLAAYQAIFDDARSRDISIVADWSAVGMIEDLPCAQPDRTSVTSCDPSARPDRHVLHMHAQDVHDLWRGRAVLLVLDIPFDVASQRALAERGASWITKNFGIAKLPTDPVSAFAERARRFAPRVAGIIEAHRSGGWKILHVDASADPSQVCNEALRLIDPGR